MSQPAGLPRIRRHRKRHRRGHEEPAAVGTVRPTRPRIAVDSVSFPQTSSPSLVHQKFLFFRRSVSSALSQMNGDNSSSESSGTQKKPSTKKPRQRQLVISDSEESDGSGNSSDEHDEPNQPLKRFLAAYSLEEHFELLLRHQIDLDTLVMLTDDDLKFLNLPLGPYRRLAVAIQDRKSALSNPGAIIDSRL